MTSKPTLVPEDSDWLIMIREGGVWKVESTASSKREAYEIIFDFRRCDEERELYVYSPDSCHRLVKANEIVWSAGS